jgi:hypothetical protein
VDIFVYRAKRLHAPPAERTARKKFTTLGRFRLSVSAGCGDETMAFAAMRVRLRAALLGGAGLCLAACAAPMAQTEPVAKAPAQPASPAVAALVFTPEPGKDFGDVTAFSRSVLARYPAPQPLAALVSDLTAQGLSCSGLTGVAPSADMALMDCVRTDSAGGVCFDTFALTVMKAPGEGMASVSRPRYARRCLGALPAK